MVSSREEVVTSKRLADAGLCIRRVQLDFGDDTESVVAIHQLAVGEAEC